MAGTPMLPPFVGPLSTIKVKEGDTVKVGSLLGIVEVEKSDLAKTAKIETVDQPTYTSSKTVEKNKRHSRVQAPV